MEEELAGEATEAFAARGAAAGSTTTGTAGAAGAAAGSTAAGSTAAVSVVDVVNDGAAVKNSPAALGGGLRMGMLSLVFN